jgi:hypothetical protein
MKKTRSKKSRDTVPLMFEANIASNPNKCLETLIYIERLGTGWPLVSGLVFRPEISPLFLWQPPPPPHHKECDRKVMKQFDRIACLPGCIRRGRSSDT